MAKPSKLTRTQFLQDISGIDILNNVFLIWMPILIFAAFIFSWLITTDEDYTPITMLWIFLIPYPFAGLITLLYRSSYSDSEYFPRLKTHIIVTWKRSAVILAGIYICIGCMLFGGFINSFENFFFKLLGAAFVFGGPLIIGMFTLLFASSIEDDNFFVRGGSWG